MILVMTSTCRWARRLAISRQAYCRKNIRVVRRQYIYPLLSSFPILLYIFSWRWLRLLLCSFILHGGIRNHKSGLPVWENMQFSHGMRIWPPGRLGRAAPTDEPAHPLQHRSLHCLSFNCCLAPLLVALGAGLVVPCSRACWCARDPRPLAFRLSGPLGC